MDENHKVELAAAAKKKTAEIAKKLKELVDMIEGQGGSVMITGGIPISKGVEAALFALAGNHKSIVLAQNGMMRLKPDYAHLMMQSVSTFLKSQEGKDCPCQKCKDRRSNDFKNNHNVN